MKAQMTALETKAQAQKESASAAAALELRERATMNVVGESATYEARPALSRSAAARAKTNAPGSTASMRYTCGPCARLSKMPLPRRWATTARGGFCRANREVVAARRGWLGVSWAASRQEGAAPPCISAVGVRGVHAGGQRRLGVHGLWRRT